MAQILVVDDEVGIRELLPRSLEDEGHQVALAESGRPTHGACFRERARPDLVLLDIWHAGHDGITTAQRNGRRRQLTMPW